MVNTIADTVQANNHIDKFNKPETVKLKWPKW